MNEYLKEYTVIKHDRISRTHFFAERAQLVKKYSWAIPCDAALDAIKALGKPVVEMGAGTGYWAYLLKRMGVSVLAYDRFPPKGGKNFYKHTHEWVQVLPGCPSDLVNHPDRVLLLCWPPYDNSMASECLRWYRGTHVVFIGEYDGCTGDSLFFAELERKWRRVSRVVIPVWFTNDALYIFERV